MAAARAAEWAARAAERVADDADAADAAGRAAVRAAERAAKARAADESAAERVAEAQRRGDSHALHDALFWAAEEGHDDVIVVLLGAGADVDRDRSDPHDTGSTPLLIAAENGHDGCVARLLGAGADVNRPHKDDWTPLFIAAQNGHDNCVAQLLGAGADVERGCRASGATPLKIAAEEGCDGCLARLLGAGADVDRPDKDGSTPLLMAAKFGNVGCVVRLLGAGAEVDRAGQKGNTPLIMASSSVRGDDTGQLDCARLLLEAGADATRKEMDGLLRGDMTALQRAEQRGHAAIAALLRDPPRAVPLLAADRRLALGAGFNARLSDGSSLGFLPPDLLGCIGQHVQRQVLRIRLGQYQ